MSDITNVSILAICIAGTLLWGIRLITRAVAGVAGALLIFFLIHLGLHSAWFQDVSRLMNAAGEKLPGILRQIRERFSDANPDR